MAKKSKAQINRMMKRAEARGEAYNPPPREEPKEQPPKDGTMALSAADQTKLQAARKLEKELEEIEQNQDLKAKERRSAKRKAEAIASEAADCPTVELLEWYAAYQKKNDGEDNKKKESKKTSSKTKEEKRHKNPYIAFVGQLSFDTTPDDLLQHIQHTLGEEFKVSNETVKIRLLSDPKTRKSRGMAFVEVDNPELLYGLLRLHQTFLQGRRINIERSAGGKANSETKKHKLEQFRKEQEEYFSEVVDKMLQGFYQDGSLQPEELDEGVIALFKRHSAQVVQAALERYVETDGKHKDNPSAYLSKCRRKLRWTTMYCISFVSLTQPGPSAFLVSKMAEEGIFEKDDGDAKSKRNNNFSRQSGDQRPTKAKKPRLPDKNDSILEQEGVNMRAVDNDGTQKDISQIFPSYRGRGRGGKP
eukprot:scaffold2536_cov169-Amphora_coffeaeformis.AAC.18